jgi:hypothetical protein
MSCCGHPGDPTLLFSDNHEEIGQRKRARQSHLGVGARMETEVDNKEGANVRADVGAGVGADVGAGVGPSVGDGEGLHAQTASVSASVESRMASRSGVRARACM